MDRTILVRWRWRLRGAWMWKLFVPLTLADALIAHWLPPVGDSESAIGAWILAVFLSLGAIVMLTWPLTQLVRHVRKDLPKVIARDYAGTAAIALITVIAIVAGVLHHSTLTGDQVALQDATARAQAYIGDHAPAQFRSNLRMVNTYEIQPPEIYRVCVFNRPQTQTYCVVVHRNRPFAHSVGFAGYEPNSLLSDGTS